MKLKPIIEGSSKAIIVKYPLPFGLNVENQDGKAVVTKDGAGGEKVGDILRLTTHWYMGEAISNNGIAGFANFAGAPAWKIGLFEVTGHHTNPPPRNPCPPTPPTPHPHLVPPTHPPTFNAPLRHGRQVDKAKTWNEVVEALTSNVPQRTDVVTMVFERAT